MILHLLADQRISVDETITLLEAVGRDRMVVSTNLIEWLKKVISGFKSQLVSDVIFFQTNSSVTPFRDSRIDILNPYI
jgi:hypothetical protein